MKTATTRRLVAVDALRAVAALAVVLNHSDLGAGHSRPPISWLEPIGRFGAEGVGLFLVLSGFSIHLRWAADRDAAFSPIRFWRRRFVRLYPTYFAALAAILVVMITLDGTGSIARERMAFHDDLPGVLSVLDHVTVIFANFAVVSLLPQAWSLALEEQIYFAYSTIGRWIARVRPLRLLAVSFAITACWAIFAGMVASTGTARTMVYMHVPARQFEWLLGLVAAEAYVGRFALPRVLRHPLVAFAAIIGAAAIATHPFHPIGSLDATDLVVQPLFGTGFFVSLNWLIAAEPKLLASRARRAFTALGTLGLGSYSIYLLHPIIMRAVQHVISGGGVAGRLVTWTAVIAVSWLFYLLVERHFIARARPPRGDSAWDRAPALGTPTRT